MTDNQLHVFTLHDHNFNSHSPFQKKHFPRKQSLQHHIAGYHELSQLLALTSPDRELTTHSIEEFITRQDLQLVFAFRLFANEHIQIEEFATRQDLQAVFAFVFFCLFFVFFFQGNTVKKISRIFLNKPTYTPLRIRISVFPTNHFTANTSSSFKLVTAIACYKWHLRYIIRLIFESVHLANHRTVHFFSTSLLTS